MNRVLIDQILRENVKNYDLIAEDFDKTRAFLWPEVEVTASYIAPKSQVLDIGCGNGRLLPLVTQNGGKYLGFDISENLIEIAKKKYGEEYFLVGDLLSYTAYYQLHTTFDIIYCLAVLHHIPSNDLRLQALKNLKSLLKPNGILILSAWNLWQKKYLKYIIREFFLKLIGKSKLDWKDCYIPYKIPNSPGLAKRSGAGKFQIPNNNLKLKINKFKNSLKIENWNLKIINRYLHAFTLKELVNLIKESGFDILENKRTRGNYLVVAKSISNRLPKLKLKKTRKRKTNEIINPEVMAKATPI